MLMSRSTPAVWEKGQGFPGIGPLPTFLTLTVCLGSVVPVAVSLSFQTCCSECTLRLKV